MKIFLVLSSIYYVKPEEYRINDYQKMFLDHPYPFPRNNDDTKIVYISSVKVRIIKTLRPVIRNKFICLCYI